LVDVAKGMKKSAEVRELLGLEHDSFVIEKDRRWFLCVECKDGAYWAKHFMMIEIDGTGHRGQPRQT